MRGKRRTRIDHRIYRIMNGSLTTYKCPRSLGMSVPHGRNMQACLHCCVDEPRARNRATTRLKKRNVRSWVKMITCLFTLSSARRLATCSRRTWSRDETGSSNTMADLLLAVACSARKAAKATQRDSPSLNIVHIPMK